MAPLTTIIVTDTYQATDSVGQSEGTDKDIQDYVNSKWSQRAPPSDTSEIDGTDEYWK